MPPMDEFKEETEEILKNASLWKKAKYYIYYYKWYALALLIVFGIAFSWIKAVVTQKEAALFVALINSEPKENAEEFDLAYASYAEIDLNQNSVTLDTSMQISSTGADQQSMAASQKLLAYASVGDIDIFEANKELFANYASRSYFLDLRDILPEDVLAKYESHLYYIDRPVLEALTEAEQGIEDEMDIKIPNPTKPELMEDPIPIGLFVDGLTTLEDYYYIDGRNAVLGIPANTKNPDNAVKFIQFITR